MDMNDRALRSIISSLGGRGGGFATETGFNFTAASEIMAILCMSRDLEDLQERMGSIYVGETRGKEPVFAKQLNAQGAMTLLMKDAIKPNLVQTLEGNPTLIHGGPFANIAQGTNSIIATKMGMKLADYTITEAGFGADLGAEKFMNIKCRAAGINPKAVVIVATIRALKYHGGQALADLKTPNVEALKAGLPNLGRHIESMQTFGMPVVISINRFTDDSEEEIAAVKDYAESLGVRVALSEGWAKGGEGCLDLADRVMEAVAESNGTYQPTYDLEDSIEEKITKVVQKIYGGEGVEFAAKAKRQMAQFAKLGFDKLPICMAKTQKSLSDNDKLLGRPTGFTVTVREFEVAAGAGFIIPICGNMMRMPGLPATPAAEGMSIDANGVIDGLS
jgi:formate--tetrahydrofolate ligase